MKSVLAGIAVLAVLGVAFFLWNRSDPLPATEPTQQADDIVFGFIERVDTANGYTIYFDPAEWLTGEEGQNAAIAAGLCTENTRDECLPNDFFILNDSTSTVPYGISANPIIAMMTLHMSEQGVKEEQISPEQFAALINDPTLHWTKVPYQMLVEGNRATIVEEVYIP